MLELEAPLDFAKQARDMNEKIVEFDRGKSRQNRNPKLGGSKRICHGGVSSWFDNPTIPSPCHVLLQSTSSDDLNEGFSKEIPKTDGEIHPI